jgi:hypothetical protein
MEKSLNYNEVSCRYFTRPGSVNTPAVFEAAVKRARALKIGRIVVATCSGLTALAAGRAFDSSMKIVAVTHATGFKEADVQELTDENRRELQARGIEVLTCAHAFGGVGRGIRNKVGAYQVDEIMAYTLRMFGQGTKVAVEIALMAADAGLIRTDEDVISIGGTKDGADTALVLRPSTSARCLDLKIREILCKPADL